MPEPCSKGATQDANLEGKEPEPSASGEGAWAREARGRKEVAQTSAGGSAVFAAWVWIRTMAQLPCWDHPEGEASDQRAESAGSER